MNFKNSEKFIEWEIEMLKSSFVKLIEKFDGTKEMIDKINNSESLTDVLHSWNKAQYLLFSKPYIYDKKKNKEESFLKLNQMNFELSRIYKIHLEHFINHFDGGLMYGEKESN